MIDYCHIQYIQDCHNLWHKAIAEKVLNCTPRNHPKLLSHKSWWHIFSAASRFCIQNKFCIYRTITEPYRTITEPSACISDGSVYTEPVLAALHICILKNTRSYGPYAALLLAPAEGFCLQPRFFCPSGKKRDFNLQHCIFWGFCIYPLAWYITLQNPMKVANFLKLDTQRCPFIPII